MKTAMTLQREADAFNALYPVGTPVEHWPGVRDMSPHRGVITHPAQTMSDHVSVWVTGAASSINLSHVQPLTRIKCLTVWNPYATAMAIGAKEIETRGYPGERLGLRVGDLVAIHAAARRVGFREIDLVTQLESLPSPLPYSSVLSLHRYQGSSPSSALLATISDLECILGDYSDGRYGWHLPRVQRFETPLPHVGKQGIGYWVPPVGLEILPQEG